MKIISILLFCMFPVCMFPVNSDIEQTIIVPLDATTFTIKQNEIVRFEHTVVFGSKAVVQIRGPAKIQSENNTYKYRNGIKLNKTFTKEFEIKSTSKGEVKVMIIVFKSINTERPDIFTYKFNVE